MQYLILSPNKISLPKSIHQIVILHDWEVGIATVIREGSNYGRIIIDGAWGDEEESAYAQIAALIEGYPEIQSRLFTSQSEHAVAFLKAGCSDIFAWENLSLPRRHHHPTASDAQAACATIDTLFADKQRRHRPVHS